MKSRILAIILVVLISITGGLSVAAESMDLYEDVTETDWFYDSVMSMYQKTWMTGLSDTQFGPYELLSRAQFAVILYRMENKPEVIYENDFPDVPLESWYTDAVAWAKENNIITGYADGMFGPADSITREQLVVMLYRYMQYKGQNTKDTLELDTYIDAEDVSEFAIDALEWALGNRIITGKDNGTKLDPQGTATRAECAVILHRSFLKETASMPPEGERDFLASYEAEGTLPSICELYADNFKVGAAFWGSDLLDGTKKETIAYQFNSMTCENEHKADYTFNYDKTVDLGNEEYLVADMRNSDWIMRLASENGLQMRYHTLIWHSQTPRWIFTEGFSRDADAPFVTREVMLARMESYLQQVMEYCNETYPGLIYCWDVVNEAIDPYSPDGNGIRLGENYYYQIIGEDYIEKAFEYARKYAAPDQKLFYNDYNCYESARTNTICKIVEPLIEKNLIDGIGMQSHVQMYYPSLDNYEKAILRFGELGLEVQITELDVANEDGTESGQWQLAKRYKDLFSMYKRIDDSGKTDITCVTIWGLTDDKSWLNSTEKPRYPLLFNKDTEPKMAFFGAILDDSI